jgi:hypothetical protein
MSPNVASRRRLAEHRRGQMCRSADASGGAETKERTRDAALTRLLGAVCFRYLSRNFLFVYHLFHYKYHLKGHFCHN